MRKVNPADVRADFSSAATELIDHFDRTAGAIASLPTVDRDTSQLATQSFLALFVAFERFASDLLIAYLNRDFSAYQSSLHARLRTSVRERYGDAVAALLTIRTYQHIPMQDLEAIIDPTGWNLTFNSTDKLKTFASGSLAAQYAQRINSISTAEGRLIDTARAVRNFIAHQSRGSKQLMNDALNTVETGNHNRHLGRTGYQVHSAGAYLKAAPAGLRRLHRYASGLMAISAHM